MALKNVNKEKISNFYKQKVLQTNVQKNTYKEYL